MAGSGANFVLDKGFLLLSTYNSSAAAGALSKRLVKFSGTAGAVDLNVASTTRSLGVLMENVDQVKIAQGKVIADVRLQGIATINCTTAASIVLGSMVASTSVGGVILAASTFFPIGIVVGITGTIADGNDIQVMLTPGLPVL